MPQVLEQLLGLFLPFADLVRVLAQVFHQLGQHVVHRRFDEIELLGEMMPLRATRQLGTGHDLVHGRAVVTEFGDAAQCRADQPLPGMLTTIGCNRWSDLAAGLAAGAPAFAFRWHLVAPLARNPPPATCDRPARIYGLLNPSRLVIATGPIPPSRSAT